MAGDPVCDAFRAQLQTILTEALIAWPIVDTDEEDPDASEPFIQVRFEGGVENRFARGGGGSGDTFEETGQVFIDFCVPLGTDNGRELQEVNSRAVRTGFKGLFFNTSIESGAIEIQIVTVMPLSGGQGVDGGMVSKTIGLDYRIFNNG